MTVNPSPHAVLDELAGHLRGDDLARLVHTAAFAAADERRTSLHDGLAELADRAGLGRTDADTRFGNVLDVLEQGSAGTAGPDGRALLSVLLARGVVLSPPEGAEAEGRVAEALVWLATYTPVDALGALDAVLGERARGLWKAVAALVQRADAAAWGQAKAPAGADAPAPHVGRAGAIVAAAAIRGRAGATARAEIAALAAEVRDPVVRSLLQGAAAAGQGSAGEDAAPPRSPAKIEGELVPAPRGAVPLVLLAVTGVLVVLHGIRLLARLLLRYRRPAAIEVSARGVTVRARTEVFGRTVRERETHIPRDALLRATREVRYPRLGLYAGLIALALGTFVGASLLVDGARAGSPDLLGIGALVVAVGAALDFGLSHLSRASRERVRVIIVPRRGTAVALGGVERAAADAALGRLSRA